MSHEKVNSGFIYGLSLAFPGERIVFYADATHCEAIQRILTHDGVEINDIEYKSINISSNASFSIIKVLVHYIKLFQVFTEVINLGVNKVFFLAFTPEILYAIKRLKNIKKFSHLKFTFVLHGGFESIADDAELYSGIELVRNRIPASTRLKFIEKVIQTPPIELPAKIYRKILSKIHVGKQLKLEPIFFSVKKIMEHDHSEDYKYIALSPHIVKNAQKYIDVDKFKFYTVILPTNFVKPTIYPKNKYPKFATFGYGDSLVLHNIAYLLAKKNITKPYEIKIIGMDNGGVEEFSFLTCASGGRLLDREEMERQAVDIDAFLILYDKSRYRLSCSGSMLESLSMIKPIVHFDNDCINQFNTINNPIGFCCYSLDEYVDKLTDIIENYDLYEYTFASFRKNIMGLRDECAIINSVPQLIESFTW